MNCKEFKNKVADLFDTTIDSHVMAECQNHIDSCPDCKAYYENIKAAFESLQPAGRNDSAQFVKTNGRKKRTAFWKTIAAAASMILAVGLLSALLFSSPAKAETNDLLFFEQSISCIREAIDCRMKVDVRTTPYENFRFYDPKADFLTMDVLLLRQDGSMCYRVEKPGGRVVVSDGSNQYMWIPGILYLKGTAESNFLEDFKNLLFPDRLLSMQKSAVEFSDANKVTRIESDSTVTLRFEGKKKNGDLRQLLRTGKMDDCDVVIENVFSKDDHLLRSLKLWVVDDGRQTLLVDMAHISYNVQLSMDEVTKLPDVPESQWNKGDVNAQDVDRLARLQQETPEEAAQRIVNAFISGQMETAQEALCYYKVLFAEIHRKFKGCRATDFKARKSDDYAGVYVFYVLTNPDGSQENMHISVRKDNPQHIWIADGGI